MTYHVDDERKLRVSKSGFSIKTGIGDGTRIVAKYPGIPFGPDFDGKAFTRWLDDAEAICDAFNAQFTVVLAEPVGMRPVPNEGLSNAAYYHSKLKDAQARIEQLSAALSEMAEMCGGITSPID